MNIGQESSITVRTSKKTWISVMISKNLHLCHELRADIIPEEHAHSTRHCILHDSLASRINK
jgi:hypothetical protein